MAQKLTADARKSALAKLSGWSDVAGREAITKKFTFKDFNQAFGFMTRAALVGKRWTTTLNGSMSTKRSR